MITISRDSLPDLLRSEPLLEIRVFYTATGWTWDDYSSRLKSHGPIKCQVENQDSGIFGQFFDATVSNIEIDNSDNFLDQLITKDGGLWNDDEPYSQRLRGRWMRVGRKDTYEDGTSAKIWLGCGVVEDWKNDNTKGTVTFSLSSLSRRAMEQRADAQKVNAHSIIGPWVNPYDPVDPTDPTPLYYSRVEEPITGSIKKVWFENRKIKDILYQICNALDDEDPIIDEVIVDAGLSGQRICSSITRPPANDYPSDGVFCRAIAWDETNSLLWLGCDDPDNLGSVYIYKYDPALSTLSTFERVAYIRACGRVFNLWWNKGTDPSVSDTLTILCTEDTPPGEQRRGKTWSYAFKLSTSSAYVVLNSWDALAGIQDLCRGVYSYRKGYSTSELYNGIKFSALIGDDTQDHGGSNRRVDHYVGENIRLPFLQRLTPRINKKPWTYNGLVTQASLKRSLIDVVPNRYTGPQATYIDLPYNLPAGCYRVRSGRLNYPDNDWVRGNLRHSFGQDGTTIFVQERSSGKGSIIYMTYAALEPEQGAEYRMWELNLGTGAITDRGRAGDDTMQFTFLCSRCGGSVITGGYLILDDSDQANAPAAAKADFRIHNYIDGVGWSRLYTHNYNLMILEAIEVSTGEVLASVYNRGTGEYQIQLINAFTLGFPGTPVLRSGGSPPVSGMNQFRGFKLCPTTAPYSGDGRIYFYEVGPYLLYSFDPISRTCRVENAPGESPLPIIDGETNGASNLAFGVKSGAWILYGVSCRQYIDRDGSSSGVSALPYDPSAAYFLWQYANEFSGFCQLLDFEELTLHDIRSKFAEMLNAVFYYDQGGTFNFKKRPVYGSSAVTFDNVLEMQCTTRGYKSITNYLTCLSYIPSTQPLPTSIPYSLRGTGSTGILKQCDTNYVLPRVQKWMLLFNTATSYAVYYQDLQIDPLTWIPAGQGDINSDFRSAYVAIPSANWMGIPVAGDQYGFYVYPPTKKLQQLTDQEKIEVSDGPSIAKYGQQEQELENRFIPRILVLRCLQAILAWWKDPHAVYACKGPLYDALALLSQITVLDQRWGTGTFYVNGCSPEMNKGVEGLELVQLRGPDDYGGWGASGT